MGNCRVDSSRDTQPAVYWKKNARWRGHSPVMPEHGPLWCRFGCKQGVALETILCRVQVTHKARTDSAPESSPGKTVIWCGRF